MSIMRSLYFELSLQVESEAILLYNVYCAQYVHLCSHKYTYDSELSFNDVSCVLMDAVVIVLYLFYLFKPCAHIVS
jgi:hypothetical protein